MTEKNKRFTMEKSENQDTIVDNKGIDDYYHLGNDTRDVTAICDLLNEQDARIKYLERKLERERSATQKQHEKWSKQAEERIRELENSKKQLKRVYNYFMDYLEDEMSRNSFSEMWDFVITDEKWD